MKKVKLEVYIQRFIREEKPTPKELRYFCKCVKDLTGESGKYRKLVVKVKVHCESYTYQELNICGYYGTNIGTWVDLNNVEVLENRYQLTGNFLKHGISLYRMTTNEKISRLEETIERYQTGYRPLVRRNNALCKELREIRTDMEHHLSRINTVLTENFN